MKTSTLVGSLTLAVAIVTPAFAATSDDLVPLDSMIVGAPTRSCRIKVGTDQDEVRASLGAPDVMLARNLWAYVNLTLRGPAPAKSYDALVIWIVDGRVRELRLTSRTAVFALVARLNQATTRGEVTAAKPRP